MVRPRAGTDSSMPGSVLRWCLTQPSSSIAPGPPLGQQPKSVSLEENEPEGKGKWVMGTPGNRSYFQLWCRTRGMGALVQFSQLRFYLGGVIPSGAQGFFLALHSGVSPSRAREGPLG